MTVKATTKSISSENTFSDGVLMSGYFNFSISGTWSGTVTLQRSFDDGSTWLDVDTRISNIEEFGIEPERGVQYRAGIKTGAYTSGAAVIRLSQ